MSRSLAGGVFSHGNVGVDFFFVLSGFIIMFAHAGDIGKPRELRRYLRNRFVRVYPIYWFYTAVTVGGVLLGLSATIHLPGTPEDWFSSLSLIRVSHVKPPISLAWTLFYEIAFYALFSTLIISRRLGAVMLCGWLLVIIGVHHSTEPPSIVAVFTSRICLNFFIGMAAYWLHTRVGRAIAYLALVGGGVAFLAMMLWADRLDEAQLGVCVGVACGLIVAGFAAAERGRVWRLGPLVWLGNASFTLYLVHLHVETPMFRYLRAHASGLNADLLFIGILGATALISLALYTLVEAPLVRLCRGQKLIPSANPRVPESRPV